MLLSTKGELAVKITALTTIESTPSYGLPIWLALAVVIFKPLLNNIGLLSREGFDKLTQKALTKLNIKSYRTEEEFQAVVDAKEAIVIVNSKLRDELSTSTQVREDLTAVVRDSKSEILKLTSENSKVTEHNSDLEIKYTEISARYANLQGENNKITEKLSVAIDNNNNKDKEITSLRSNNNEKDQEIAGLKNELAELKVGISNDEKLAEIKKSSDDQKTTEDKEYYFLYNISDEVRKSESLKGNSYDPELELYFDRNELDEDLFTAFHEVNYSGNVGAMPRGHRIQINEPTTRYNTRDWDLNESPKGLTNVDILKHWYSDYGSNEVVRKVSEELI